MYNNYYQARKANPDSVIVKVEGGYVAMGYNDYKIWKNQK